MAPNDLSSPCARDDRLVFFFDTSPLLSLLRADCVHLDNCLYPKSMKIHDMMVVKIRQYFMKHLKITDEEAEKLHNEYYKSYGLALEGLVRHHKIDPLAYNREVDDTLELDTVLKPDEALTELLTCLDTSKVKPWILTNAYITHAKRVLKLLDIEHFFEGVTYCDYGQEILICKPKAEMFEKAMMEAGITDNEKCLFVDDSYVNVVGAKEFGWKEVCHLLFPEDKAPPPVEGIRQLRDLRELREIYPHVFRTGQEMNHTK